MIIGASQQQLHKGTHLICDNKSYVWSAGFGTETATGHGLTAATIHPSKRGIVGESGTKASFRYWTNGTFGTIDNAGANIQNPEIATVNPSGTYAVICATPTTASIRIAASDIDITAADGTSVSTRYTPSSMGSLEFYEADFGPAETDVVVSSGGGPILMQAWAWSNSTQWGTKRSNSTNANTATAAIRAEGTRFSPFGNAVFMGGYGSNSTPFLYAYAYTEGTGFGTKYANVSATSLDSNEALYVTGSSATSQKIVFGGYSVAPIVVNFSSSTGFGTKLSNPAAIRIFEAAGTYNKGIDIGNNGSDIAYTSGTDGIVVFTWTNSSGFGTRYTSPATVPTGTSPVWTR